MNLGDVTTILSSLLIFAGALLTLSAAVGLVRFNTTLHRMHPAAKPQVLGLILVITGAVLQTWRNPDVFMLVLVAMFTLVTSPVIANRMGNVAYRESLRLKSTAGRGPDAPDHQSDATARGSESSS